MELRRRIWLLSLLVIAGHSDAQEDAAGIFARAEKLRVDAKSRKEAIALYEKAAELWKGQEEEGRARWRLGQLLDVSGDRVKALEAFRAGLERAKEPKLVAGLQYGVGRVLVALGRLAEGIESYQKALEIRRETGERFEQALALHNLGSAYWSLGRNEEAVRAYDEALEIRRELKDEVGVAYTLFGLASVQFTWGELEQALREYERALGIWRRLKNVRGEADSLNGMGLMYSLLGDQRRARLQYGEALRLWSQAGDPVGEAYTLSNLGMVEGAAGRASFEKALKVLREKGDRRGQAYVLHNLAGLDGTVALFEESLAIKRSLGDRYGEAQTLEKLGEAYLKAGRVEESLANAGEAARMQQELGNKLGEAAAEAVRGRALLKLGRVADARQAIGVALERVEGLRASVVNVELRASFFATQQRIYRDAIAVLMEAGRTHEAFEVSERARARTLLDRVSAAREVTPATRELAAREAQLTREIHAQAQRIQRLSGEKLGAELTEAKRSLDRLFESWSRVLNEREKSIGVEVKPVLSQLQNEVLDAGTALVEYSIDGNQGWAWVVTRTEVKPVRLVSKAALAAVVRRQRAALAGKAADSKVDRELMRLLIEPLGLSPSIRRLAMVLDAPLNQVSFAAVGGLIDRYELVEVPSAATMIALRGRPKSTGRRSVQIVADPVFDVSDARVRKNDDTLVSEQSSEHRRLHFSRIEAEEILKIAGAAANQFQGFEAEKGLLGRKSFEQASIVHLATHAQVDEERPELSAVLFAGVDGGGKERNGHLRLYEIYRLRLRADLVVLSGCTTALGTELSGEGTMSLARGFLYAGAGKVMASQWEVEDRATAELMKRFYEGLLMKRLPAAAALRRAQLAMRADARWKEPYYWAGFRLAGDWR